MFFSKKRAFLCIIARFRSHLAGGNLTQSALLHKYLNHLVNTCRGMHQNCKNTAFKQQNFVNTDFYALFWALIWSPVHFFAHCFEQCLGHFFSLLRAFLDTSVHFYGHFYKLFGPYFAHCLAHCLARFFAHFQLWKLGLKWQSIRDKQTIRKRLRQKDERIFTCTQKAHKGDKKQ